ncbi:PEP-CTERM system histidine kinase PrsK [Massilia sp. Dwa41.01b]|uniref:XrtA/PEP-CTERM system histidine kinase PrsK n=1 Tax=unclassified Massilia TaxID=2609279 RepID=UPI001601E8ED|nr:MULTISPECIES: XrtA/PEP-CTERM system histidine kinase PrsK [unclassified Massilia]QNA90829.1 PEP-CTERM system histidine kinase PrsK [Massilia sp. Dwa41.01b]QNA98072.1 PEP-CTERM system histidine kinase PrsK [Massilia sp. Se16.2.3]
MDSVSLTSIAAYSYGLAAIGFVGLGVPLLTGWRGRAYGPVLVAAVLASAFWAGSLAWAATDLMMWTALSDGFEVARNAAWSLFLVVLLGDWRKPGSRLPLGMRPTLFVAAVCYLLALVAAVFGYWNLALVNSVLPVMARVMEAVGGMLLVEQTYRNKNVQERWAIKFACLGIGGMFAYDFYLYSHAMLFREVDPDIWAARGVINALTVPLLAISMGRAKSWRSPLAVSRRVMFHSAALFGSAIYLLAMGSAGYYLRYFGGSWGTVMQVTFLFGALLLLAGILFSGTFRAWLKVFISKHFYSYGYDYREEWMRFTRTLSEAGPNLGERAVQAVAALVESPGGGLWQRRESGACEPLAHWQVPAIDAIEPFDSSLCRFLESTQWVIDLNEYAEEPEKYEGLTLPDWLRSYPRGWLVVPLMLGTRLFGFVVLQTARSPVKLNWEVIDLLDIAGSQAASYLAQQDAANELMVARQFESFNRMSTFVVHDLKNLVSQLSLMNANAEKHKHNPEFQADMLETVSLSVQKMRLMLQKLSRIDIQEKPVPLNVDQVVRQAMAQKAAFEPRPTLDVLDTGLRVLADRERLERVVGHLIQNAIEATPKEGSVRIALTRVGEAVQIEITDTGEGMSEEFIRERLFKPFESTKSAGMGIGVFESREYIHELGGRLEVSSQPTLGTTFKVILPLYQQDALLAERAA